MPIGCAQPAETPLRVSFPRFPLPGAGAVAGLHDQLRQFERLPPRVQQRIQLRQLTALMRHAQHQSPFWRERIGPAQLPPLNALPALTRAELQDGFVLMRARGARLDASLIETAQTSGSTGRPVRIERLRPLYDPLYHACTLLEHHWHGRDQTRRLSIVCSGIATARTPHWGPPFVWLGPSGRRFSFDSAGASVEHILSVLARERPDYLVINAPLVANLAREALAGMSRRPRIEQVLAFGGPLAPHDRAAIQAAFGSKAVNRYTSEEIGYIAIQCPRHEHYHVLSGTVLVEIVDERGRACPAGTPGRVLVTSLHSYAMPLIRYEIGDIAEWGKACDCGITLPVIRRILGRSWRLITRPDCKRILARIEANDLAHVPGLLEWRFVLHADNVIAAYLRAARPLIAGDTDAIRRVVHANLGYPYDVVIHQVERIDWMHEWKREDFAVLNRPYCAGSVTPSQWHCIRGQHNDMTSGTSD
jgi:phenylacetate-CoA ligase